MILVSDAKYGLSEAFGIGSTREIAVCYSRTEAPKNAALYSVSFSCHSLGRPDMNYLEPDLFQYSDTQGTRSFREEIAKFLTHCARAAKTLNLEHITVMNGCCAVFATLSTVLCDPADGYLIPAPYYGGINLKTWLYGGIQPVHVPLFSEVTDKENHPFQLTGKLEDALQTAKKQDIIACHMLKSSGELYVWADFRKFLKSQTFEAELELWQKLLDKKLLISPGKAFYCYEPGWFRLVFSDSVDKIYLRIQIPEQTLHSYAAEPVTNNTSSAADASCNPEKDCSGKPSNTPGKDVSQLKNVLVY
ncbi:LOW QUALITY PROTEIN: 1-aminocyclopropane-1-carboxylate synthase-like protein 1 [Pterocles gutturalis]